MKILLIDNDSSYINSLERLLRPHDVRHIEWGKVATTEDKEYDAIILSGGHKKGVLSDGEAFEPEIALISKTTKPVFGVCLGFQLIGVAHGATLQKMDAPEKGVLEISIERKDPIFEDVTNLSAYESHRWVITETPDSLLPLARSRDGVEVVKHQEKLIYGTQFHPERHTDKTSGQQLVKNFLAMTKGQDPS